MKKLHLCVPASPSKYCILREFTNPAKENKPRTLYNCFNSSSSCFTNREEGETKKSASKPSFYVLQFRLLSVIHMNNTRKVKNGCGANNPSKNLTGTTPWCSQYLQGREKAFNRKRRTPKKTRREPISQQTAQMMR